MLLIGRIAENVRMYRNNLIFLLQGLGFAVDLIKSVMTLSQEMEFLRMVINSKEMTICLPEERL